MNDDLRALGSIRRSVPQRGGRKIPSVYRRTNMDGGTRISGAAVGVLAVVGCATAISGFTVGGNRAVSPLVSTVAVADEASPAVGSSSAPDCSSTIQTGATCRPNPRAPARDRAAEVGAGWIPSVCCRLVPAAHMASGKRTINPLRFGICTLGSVCALIVSFSPISLFCARMKAVSAYTSSSESVLGCCHGIARRM